MVKIEEVTLEDGTREVLEVTSVFLTLGTVIASTEGMRREVVLLGFGAALTAVLSLFSSGPSLTRFLRRR